MQFRNGLISMEDYLQNISRKIRVSQDFSSDYSIARLAAEWNTEEGNKQYGNIYFLGALTACMLDIKLLELSNGERGLREVYLQLINKYGKDKPFENDTFVDEVVKMTYPEIRNFFDNYIFDNKPLPVEEYFSKLGINYILERESPEKRPVFGLGLGTEDGEHLYITNFSENHKNFGLEIGDVILKVFGEEMNIFTSDQLLEKKNSMKPGDKYEITVKRGDEEITLEGILFVGIDKNVLEVDPEASEEQKALCEAWSKNL
jgi:predicted metalloprotease with PDZ domain